MKRPRRIPAPPVSVEEKLAACDRAAVHIQPYFGNGAPDVSLIAAAIVDDLAKHGWRHVEIFGKCGSGELYLDAENYMAWRTAVDATREQM